MITILSAMINYAAPGGTTVKVACSTSVSTPLGGAQLSGDITMVESQSLPNPDWTNDELRSAVASSFGINVSEVEIFEEGA